MYNENYRNFGLTEEQMKKINIPRKVSTIKSLAINHCYGVPDTFKFNIISGWNPTKYYLILVDTEEAFTLLKTAFEDMFVNFHLNTIDNNENSGIGINDELFSGKLTEDDIQYVPQLKKANSSKTTALFKFHKQSIVITTNPQEIFAPYGRNKYLTIDDIGFFSLREGNTSFTAQLKDYSTFLKFAEKKKLKGIDLLGWLYRNIMDGRFLYKPETTLAQQSKNNLIKLQEKINLTNEFLKDKPSMSDVVDKMYSSILKNSATPIEVEAEIEIEEN